MANGNKKASKKKNRGRPRVKTTRPSVSKLKKKLDRIFSEYTRKKHAFLDGNTCCVTCGRIGHWKQMHAGHFMSRRHNATRYNDMNVHSQCPFCNLYGSGEQFKYGKFIDAKYGEGTADMLNGLSKEIKQWKRCELEELIEEYNIRLENL